MIFFRYILARHVGPFLFSVFTLMFIFLLQFIMRFIDELVGKGLGFWVISELIMLNLAWMLVLAVPMSVLVSTLMAFGGLSSHNEITAMKGSGLSLYRMMAPVFAASLLLAFLLIEFNNNILPEANHRAKTLMIDIRRKKPTLTLVPGLFSQDISGYSMLVRKTFEHSNDLEGVTIYDYTDPSAHVVVTAERGTVSFTSDYRNLIMDLWNGEIHEVVMKDPQNYRKLRFEKHRILMRAEGFEFERTGAGTFSRGDRELSAAAMQQIVDSLESENAAIVQRFSGNISQHFNQYLSGSLPPSLSNPSRQQAISSALGKARYYEGMITNDVMRLRYNEDRIRQYLVEIHKKYSIPAACLVFVLIGAPLGIMARRGGFGVAATLSLGFFVLYWSCLIGGEKLGDRGFISPFLGMWIANIIIGAAGLVLTLRMGKESMVIHWAALRQLIPRDWRSPSVDELETDIQR